MKMISSKPFRAPAPRFGRGESVDITELLNTKVVAQKWKATLNRIRSQHGTLVKHVDSSKKPKILTLDKMKSENAILMPLVGGNNNFFYRMIQTNTFIPVSNSDAATHFAGQLVEYIVLHAANLNYELVLVKLRAVAMAWGPGTKGYEEVISIINMIKEECENHTLTPSRTWLLVKSILTNGKHLTQELVTFMDNLEANAVLSYLMVMDVPEDPLKMIPGKNHFSYTNHK